MPVTETRSKNRQSSYFENSESLHTPLKDRLQTPSVSVVTDQRRPLITRMAVSLIFLVGSSSSLVDKRLVDPADTVATGLQHLEQLGGEHRPQPTQQLQLFWSPTRRSQRHINPFNGDLGEVL